MNYNILCIDDKSNFSKQDEHALELLVNSDLHIENKIDKVTELLKYKEIHLVIIDINIMSINSLNALFLNRSVPRLQTTTAIKPSSAKAQSVK